jgi:hypothetical protein
MFGQTSTFSWVEEKVAEFVDDRDGAGIFGRGSRRAILDEIAWHTYSSDGRSVALADLNTMIWRQLPATVKDSFFLNKACDIVSSHPLFSGSEIQGFRFSSQLIYEGVLAASIAESILNEKLRDVLCTRISKGDFHERLAFMVLSHPSMADRQKVIEAECAKLLEDYPSRLPEGQGFGDGSSADKHDRCPPQDVSRRRKQIQDASQRQSRRHDADRAVD